jgi:hypothetical protein
LFGGQSKDVDIVCSGLYVLVNRKYHDKCSWNCPFNQTKFRAAAMGYCGMFGDCRITSMGGAITAMVRPSHCKKMFQGESRGF